MDNGEKDERNKCFCREGKFKLVFKLPMISFIHSIIFYLIEKLFTNCVLKKVISSLNVIESLSFK